MLWFCTCIISMPHVLSPLLVFGFSAGYVGCRLLNDLLPHTSTYLTRYGLSVVLALCMETQYVPNLLLLLAHIYHRSICLPLIRDPSIRDSGRYLSEPLCMPMGLHK